MSHGVAEIPDFANQLLRNHDALLEAVTAFAQEASPELLVAMIANMPADVHRMQHEVNPGTQPAEADGPGEAASICIEQGLDVGASESKYCRYATGFYLGYGAFTAVELASGAKALVKGVRKAGDLADKIRDATNNLRNLRDSFRSGDRGPKTALTNEIRTDGGSDTVGLSARLESGARAARALKARNEIDNGVFERLTGPQRVELLESASKYAGSDRLINSLHADQVKALASFSIDQTDTVRLRNHLFELHEKGVDAEEIGQFAKNVRTLDGEDGLPRSVEDIVGSPSVDQFAGVRHNIENAARIKQSGATIDELNPKIRGGAGGELDIVLESGRVIESTKTFGADARSARTKVERKIDQMQAYHQTTLDGKTLDIRVEELRNRQTVKETLDDVKQGFMADTGDDLNIVVTDQSGQVLVQAS